MFVGHYGVALALKKNNAIPLGVLFIAVELIDILYVIFVILGIENMSYPPGSSGPLSLNMSFPLTHSLSGSIIISLSVFFLVKLYLSLKKRNDSKTPFILAIAVFSHWILDLVVHRPDLSLFFGIDQFRLGFALWQYSYISFPLEGLIIIIGLFLYYNANKGMSSTNKYKIGIFIGILVVINSFTLIIPNIPNSKLFAASLLFYFVLFAFIANKLYT